MGVQRASFGAGCFWGTEKYFRKEFNLIDAKYVNGEIV
jgi:peptide methionine sulfoxide reductase MsrA